MKEYLFFSLLLLFAYICVSINLDDDVLAFPYRQSKLHKRSQESCERYAYQNRTHVLYPAHNGSKIPSNSDTNEEKETAENDDVAKSTSKSTKPTTQATDAIEQILLNLKTDIDNRKNISDDKENISNSQNLNLKGDDFLIPPVLEVHHSGATVNQYRYNEKYVLYHVAYVNNPTKTISVYEPLHDGTCKDGNFRPTKVMESAISRKCMLAINAGLFNTHSGACYGNIVSDGRIVQDSGGVQNVHFGITKQGKLFFGYLSENDLVAEDFTQLVGGVIWVLKDGEPYVDKSIAAECEGSQETGSLETFSTVTSSRTLVGHDKYGRVMILQVEGKTYTDTGVSLYEAAEILKKYGAINAINLDGGGSSTMVINNTLVNYPSDKCKDDDRFRCMRNVTTILCVHEPPCPSPDCQGHGTCDHGVCKCRDYWRGENCDTLECPGQCTGHGSCTEDGCICLPGYHGDNCSQPCPSGWYGNACQQRCQCENNATCDTVTGKCSCLAGYTGSLCQYRCKLGFYGDNCSHSCICDDSCLCDPVSGTCNFTYIQGEFMQAGECFSKQLKEKSDIEGNMSQEYQNAINSIIIVSCVAILSVILNLVLLCHYCSKWRKRNKGGKVKYKRAQTSVNANTFIFKGQHYSSFTTSTTSDEETSFTATRAKSGS